MFYEIMKNYFIFLTIKNGIKFSPFYIEISTEIDPKKSSSKTENYPSAEIVKILLFFDDFSDFVLFIVKT